MRKSRFPEGQVIAILREQGAGRTTADVCRGMGRADDGSVEHLPDAGLGQGRHPREGALQHVAHAVQVVGAEGARDVRVDPVQAPGPAGLLVEADQQAAHLLTAVEVAERTAQQPHPVPGGGDGGVGLG